MSEGRGSLFEGLTSRGFTAPAQLPDNIAQTQERFLVVRITVWEYKMQRDNKEAFTLLPRDDGTYEAVRPLGSS